MFAFLALGAVATAALNGAQRFGASAIAPVVYVLAIIGAAVILAPSLGGTGLVGRLLLHAGDQGKGRYGKQGNDIDKLFHTVSAF